MSYSSRFFVCLLFVTRLKSDEIGDTSIWWYHVPMYYVVVSYLMARKVFFCVPPNRCGSRIREAMGCQARRRGSWKCTCKPSQGWKVDGGGHWTHEIWWVRCVNDVLKKILMCCTKKKCSMKHMQVFMKCMLWSICLLNIHEIFANWVDPVSTRWFEDMMVFARGILPLKWNFRSGQFGYWDPVFCFMILMFSH